MYLVLRQVMRLLSHVVLFRRVRVEGLELVPRSGPVLLIGNHIATVDPPLTGSLLRRHDVHYMTKSDSFSGPAVSRLFRWYHAYPVNRGRADRAALRYSLELLDAGHVVVIYPEGSRSPDASLRRPHPGAGFLARHSRAVIVPVAIWGSERVLPKGARWPRRSLITITFGRPFRLPATGSDGTPLSNQRAADLMLWRVAELLPPDYRGVFTSGARVEATPPPVV